MVKQFIRYFNLNNLPCGINSKKQTCIEKALVFRWVKERFND